MQMTGIKYYLKCAKWLFPAQYFIPAPRKTADGKNGCDPPVTK